MGPVLHARRLAGVAVLTCLLLCSPFPGPGGSDRPGYAKPAAAAKTLNSGSFKAGLAPAGVPREAWRDLQVLAETQRKAGLSPAVQAGKVTCNAAGCSRQIGARLELWNADTGAHLVRDAVHRVWNTPEGASLGFPIRSEYPHGNGFRTDFQNGSLMYDPVTGRVMSVVPGVDESALVIGDSQTSIKTWVGQGLVQAGYRPILRGANGTGFAHGNGTVSAYAQALESHQWLLPWGEPALIILQGGGNDTAHSAAEIQSGARRLISDVRQSYPSARILMVGVIGDGTGPRKDVDRLLAATAAEAGLEFLSPGDWWARYGLNGAMRPDGRHLSPEGHARTAGVFARELERIAPVDSGFSSGRPARALQ